MPRPTHIARAVVIAAVALMVPLTAAQARPTGIPPAATDHTLASVVKAPTQLGPVFGTRTPAPTMPLVPRAGAGASVASTGFSWRDAGIGAGLVALLLGGAIVVAPQLRSRQPRHT